MPDIGQRKVQMIPDPRQFPLAVGKQRVTIGVILRFFSRWSGVAAANQVSVQTYDRENSPKLLPDSRWRVLTPPDATPPHPADQTKKKGLRKARCGVVGLQLCSPANYPRRAHRF
jgi:hypothetical protein